MSVSKCKVGQDAMRVIPSLSRASTQLNPVRVFNEAHKVLHQGQSAPRQRSQFFQQLRDGNLDPDMNCQDQLMKYGPNDELLAVVMSARIRQ